MARYRQIYIEFWQDGFVLDLTPEEKYFYIYLMTNSKTTQCGIYELPKRIIETETGYNRETVEKLLQRFVEYGKIAYYEPTKEIMILNWIKYNWINSVKVLSLINKELNEVKNIEFIKLFIQNCKDYGYRIDTLSIPHLDEVEEKKQKPSNDGGSIPYQYPMDSPSIDLGEERELEREREEEREQEREQEQELKNLRIKELKNSTTTDAIVFYQNNFGLISPSISEKILSWINDVGDEMVIEALDRALKRNKVSWGFAEFILKDWHRKGIKSIEQAKAEEIDFQNRQTYKKPFQQKQQAFEIVPDWFKNRKKQSSNSPEQLSPEEQAKEQAEVEALLRQYSSKAGG